MKKKNIFDKIMEIDHEYFGDILLIALVYIIAFCILFLIFYPIAYLWKNNYDP